MALTAHGPYECAGISTVRLHEDERGVEREARRDLDEQRADVVVPLPAQYAAEDEGTKVLGGPGESLETVTSLVVPPDGRRIVGSPGPGVSGGLGGGGNEARRHDETSPIPLQGLGETLEIGDDGSTNPQNRTAGRREDFARPGAQGKSWEGHETAC